MPTQRFVLQHVTTASVLEYSKDQFVKHLERLEKVDPALFAAEFIAKGIPAIVTDAMHAWPAKDKWTPPYFRHEFGHLGAQLYDNLFGLQSIRPLGEYIDTYFDNHQDNPRGYYVRWYVKFKPLDFFWSDDVFQAIIADWSHPYFLPTTSYVVPFCKPPGTALAHKNPFPYKGIFISARGGRTRLHRDPFGTDAVLCQFYGSKRFTFYQPADDDKLRQGHSYVDPQNPDTHAFPNFIEAQPIYDDELKPGEILFIPSGWLHDVVSVSDSISITWNFAHAARRGPFIKEVCDSANNFDRDMLEFFFSAAGHKGLAPNEMARLAQSI